MQLILRVVKGRGTSRRRSPAKAVAEIFLAFRVYESPIKIQHIPGDSLLRKDHDFSLI